MRTGDVLCDRYELREPIARGGMGEVWRAFDGRLEREVAIKVGSSEPGAPTLLEEGRAAARLDHPNIVAVHDADTHEGDPFIVMEYVAGPSLREMLREEGALSEAEAMRIGVDILDALVYAHARGVWHNDVKPENILIGPDGEARLSDFGIASVNAATVDLEEPGVRFATPAYAAPEVLAGSPPGAASDLYAAAMTIYECVAGSAPQREAEEAGAAASIVPPLWEIAPGASERLAEVLAHALEPSPVDRYGTAVAFRNALERSRSGRHPTVPIAAAPRGAGPATTRSNGTRKIALGSILAVFVGLGAIGMVLAFGGGGGDDPPALLPADGETDDNALAVDAETPTPEPTPTPTPEATSTPTATPTPEPSWPLVLYLLNGNGSPANSSTLVDMRMSSEPGPGMSLPNYSSDNDSRPGRTIDEDDKGASQDDPSKYANWVGAPTRELNFSDGHDVTVTLWYASADGEGGEHGRLEVWLHKVDSDGAQQICSGARDISTGGGQNPWRQATVSFECRSDVTVGASELLELKVTVNEHSGNGKAEDMMIAYGTAVYDAHLRFDPAGAGPVVAQPTPIPAPSSGGGTWDRAWGGLEDWFGSLREGFRR